MNFVGGLAAAAALVVAGILWLRPVKGTLAFSEVVKTEVGGMRRLHLPDCSVVQVNTDSLVDLRYTAAERRVQLVRGEALFSVAKDPARIFWVQVGAISIRAVGTQFDVRYRSDAVDVLVTEGKVGIDIKGGYSVLPPAGPAPVERSTSPSPMRKGPGDGLGEGLLFAGQKASIPLRADAIRTEVPVALTKVERRKIANSLAWMRRRLEFSSTPMADVAAEFNRYNRHKLVIADPALATQHCDGAFDTQDYESFVEALEQEFSVEAERHDEQTVLRRSR